MNAATPRPDSTIPTLPFVGRESELRALRQWHAQRRHVLILGPAGVGKSALVAQLRESLDLAVCGSCDTMRHLCAALESAFDLPAADLRLIPRKQRLLRALATADRTVVFDGVGRTTPKLSSFLECAMNRAPVWVTTRSDRARDIGHFWPLLARFQRMELRPLRPADTRQLIEAAVRARWIPDGALDAADWLHRHAAGDLRQLLGFLELLHHHDYELGRLAERRLLELDRSIQELRDQMSRPNSPP